MVATAEGGSAQALCHLRLFPPISGSIKQPHLGQVSVDGVLAFPWVWAPHGAGGRTSITAHRSSRQSDPRLLALTNPPTSRITHPPPARIHLGNTPRRKKALRQIYPPDAPADMKCHIKRLLKPPKTTDCISFPQLFLFLNILTARKSASICSTSPP